MNRIFLLLLFVVVLGGCHRKGKNGEAVTTSDGGAGSQPQLTEGQVVGALVSATEALAAADSAAVAVIPSPGINLYATVLRSDHRAIAREVRAVADSAKVGAQVSDVADRLRAEATAIATALTDTTADRGQAYLAAQVQMQKHLIGAMDSTFIPSVKTPMLRQVLEDLRPAIVAHLQRGEQLVQVFAAASAAPRQAAARISPDSARVPGDTTGGIGATPVTKPDTTKPKPDTIHH